MENTQILLVQQYRADNLDIRQSNIHICSSYFVFYGNEHLHIQHENNSNLEP